VVEHLSTVLRVHVAELWRYPVKSMIGSTVDVVEVNELGIVGDRTWATRDLERGGIRGAKKIGDLMRFAARDLPGGHVEITLPDGATVTTLDDDVDDGSARRSVIRCGSSGCGRRTTSSTIAAVPLTVTTHSPTSVP
jgi:uncharacterized protein YcbX